MERVIVVLARDHPGVLHRVVSLFRRRAHRIESLTVRRAVTPGVLRLSIVTVGNDVEHVMKQLYREVEVLEVMDLTDAPAVHRETALIEVSGGGVALADLTALCDEFGARRLEVGSTSTIIEATGAPADIERFLDRLGAFKVRDVIRSGRIAMPLTSQPSTTALAGAGTAA
jgi:acetolactate synthase I/III small subunit